MWTKMMGGPRKKAPKTIAVIDPDRCFGAFACSICQAACPVAGCIVEEPVRDAGEPDGAAAARVRLPGGLRRHRHDAVRRRGEGAPGCVAKNRLTIFSPPRPGRTWTASGVPPSHR